MRGVILAARFVNLLGENQPQELQNPPKRRALEISDVAIRDFLKSLAESRRK